MFHSRPALLSLFVALGCNAGGASAREIQAHGFTFKAPRDWQVQHVDDCYLLSSPQKSRTEEYTLSLCAKKASLEQVAVDELFFGQEEGQWMRYAGMSAPSPVDEIRGFGWTGLRVIQTCGVGDPEPGFHAAGGECLMAVVSDGTTSVMFDSVGLTREFEKLYAIIDSVRFGSRD